MNKFGNKTETKKMYGKTLHLRIPTDQLAHINRKLENGEFKNISQYVRSLIEDDIDKELLE